MLSWAFPPPTRMTDTVVDEVGEDAANGVADPPPGRIDMADKYTIAARHANRRACGGQHKARRHALGGQGERLIWH